MDTTPNRRRARSILQNRRAQLTHALLIVTYLVVYTVALSALALAPTVINLLTDPAPFEGAPDNALAAAAQLLLFEERIWPAAIALILIFGLHSLHISHRVFGPVPRMQAEAGRVAAGDLRRRIQLRTDDHMAGLSEALNEMFATLDHRLGEAQAALRACEEQMGGLARAQFTSPSDRQRAIEDLKVEVARLETQLAAFQTTSTTAIAVATATAIATDAGAAPDDPEASNASLAI
jgi:methyl-accepting chemotaxis protein